MVYALALVYVHGPRYKSGYNKPSDDNLLGVDMTDWGGLHRQRAHAPFNQVRNADGGYREYVRHQLATISKAMPMAPLGVSGCCAFVVSPMHS